VRWPFRRSRASAPSGSKAPAAPPAWQSLPPIARAAGRIEPAARVSEFLHGLAARQPASLALAPLTHDVALTAPAGIVSGVARPVVGGAGQTGPLTLLRRLQRRVLGAAPAAVEASPAVPQEASPPAAVTPPPPDEAPYDEVERIEPVETAVAVEPEVAPAREPAVARRQQDPAAAPPAEARAPAPPVQRATVAPRTVVPGARAPVQPFSRAVPRTPDADPGGLPPAPRPPVSIVTPEESAAPLATPPSPAPMQRAPERGTPVDAAPPVPGPTRAARPLASERRPQQRGLGPPLVKRPAPAHQSAVSHDATGPTPRTEQPAPTHEAVPQLRRPATPPPPAPTRQAASDAEPEAHPAPAALHVAPELVLPEAPASRTRPPVFQRVPDLPHRAPAERHPPRTPAQTARPAREQPAPHPPAPLVGRRSLARVQRAAEEVPQAVRVEVERRLRTDLSGTRIHRGGESDSAARDLSASAFTLDREIHVPSHHGPLYSGPGRSLVAHELVHVAQQRRLGGSLPSEDSPAGRALEVEAMTVEAGLSGARPAAPAPAATFDSGGSSAPAAAATTSSAPATPTHAMHSATQRAAMPAHADQPGPHENLEELADRLYGHIRTRLRSELLVDRERAGLMTDTR
jgi:hypothetical protein